MTIRLKLLSPDAKPASGVLRARREASRMTGSTRQYLVLRGGSEVALVAIDLLPDVDYLILDEIYVDSAYRSQGLGREIMKRVEALGRRQGYAHIRLCPHPIDASWPPEVLDAWYERLGYHRVPGAPDEAEKDL